MCVCEPHIVACGDFPNDQIQTFRHARSLIARESLLPSFSCLLSLFFLLFSEHERTVFHHHGPFIWFNLLSRNWNFYWDEDDNSCKCANWRLVPGRDVKPSGGHKKVQSVKCCPLLCHVSRGAIRTLTTGWLWLSLRLCCRVQSRTCLIINRHLGTQDALCSTVMKSVFITFKKENRRAVHQPCKFNHGTYA